MEFINERIGMMKFVISLILSLTLISQQALGQSQKSFESELDLEAIDEPIKKGEPAKFSGFLVPSDLYRHYRVETERASQLDLELTTLEGLLSKEDHRVTAIPAFITGTGLGIVLVLLLQKK